MHSLLIMNNKIMLIHRKKYSSRIRPFLGKNIIKVLTGQRRVGKSYLLQQIIEEIKATEENHNIIFISMEYEEFRNIKNDTDLFEYLKNRIQSDRSNFLLIDEIQEIEDFENVLRSLHAKNSCDIIITGSNANILSSELSTYLAGRYIEFHIQSLTYDEFLLFHKLENSQQSLMKYLTYGGMPYLVNLPLNDELAFEYLKNVYSTIVLKDVVQREGIRNIDFLERLIQYCADNTGSLFSANNISKYLKSQQTDISVNVVINYLRALSNAFIINKVSRVDVNGLKKFEVGEKYYFEDIGLRNCKTGFNMQRDIGKLIENAVYLHLRDLQYEVFVGKKDLTEIDFVALKDGKKVYIQAAYLLHDEATQKREIGNLISIQDNFPKYIVSMDELYRESNTDGIKHLNLRDFLLKKSLE